ncbi:MAG: hypothetical protein IJD48_02970 [Clostridia bacterium]|nr:hypothetical protein [Clostridia bacterium]
MLEFIFLELIAPFVIGVLCIIMGILNTKGKIKMLHYYHRKNITEENKIPFGRKVGIGTIIMGCAIILFCILSLIVYLTQNEIFYLIGYINLTIGFVIGIIMCFYALIKYNKGIF